MRMDKPGLPGAMRGFKRCSQLPNSGKTIAGYPLTPILGLQPDGSFLTTWWLLRGCPTRSHPELDRETPQRRWYCVLRRGRVGRRQVFKEGSPETEKDGKKREKGTKKSQKPNSRVTSLFRRALCGSSRPARFYFRGTGFAAGWSSLVARQAHNLKVVGSNPTPATKLSPLTQ